MKTKIKLNPILERLLSTKRPTNNPIQNFKVMTSLLEDLEIDYALDALLNITVDRGGDTCFTAHTDTVDNKEGYNVLDVDKKGIITVKGGGVLGADDGSGVYVLLRMILAGKRGLYVFFATEEQGRVGSSSYEMPVHIKKCVSFDRKGYDNLITHQMGERGCSSEFAQAFIAAFELPYREDPTGSYTDSYTFFDCVPECINLSVGYFDQHTKQESQDCVFLEKLVEACIALDWENLPACRDPHVIENYGYGKPAYTPMSYGNWGGNWHTSNRAGAMEDYVYNNADIVTAYLEDMGVTLQDLTDYEEALYGDKHYTYQ